MNGLNEYTEEKRIYSGFESVFAWLCLLLGYLFCRSASALHLALISLCVNSLTLLALYKKGVKIKAKSLFLCLLSLAFSFSVVITPELTALLSLFCSMLLYSLFLYSASGGSLKAAGSDLLPLNMLLAIKGAKIGDLADYFRLLMPRKSKSFKQLLYIALGLCAAVIPTMAVVSLLSYDGGFVGLLDKSFAFLKNFSLKSQISSLLFGLIIAIYLFGLYSVNTEKRDYVDIEKYIGLVEKIRVAPASAVAAAFIPLAVVYAFFFVSQWQYYLSAFSGVLPEGVENYAEYARQGFFELCSVSAINFALLAVASLLQKRKCNAEKLVLKAISLLFSLMTLVLIGTALAKMLLYIDRFGLTVKRVLASWFIVLLALIFIAVILRCFLQRFKLFTVSCCAVLAMVLLLSASNYKGLIADYNVDAFISGKTERIDITALYKLGEPSTPAMVRLAKYYESNGDDGAEEYSRLRNMLDERREEQKKKGFLRFSLPKHLASNALEEYYGEK